MKTCIVCLENKPEIEFSIQRQKDNPKVYRRSHCKSCTNREQRLRRTVLKNENSATLEARDLRQILRKHGLTQEEYDGLKVQQGGLCAICRTNISTAKKRLAIDHNHLTGVIRGLLCGHCNRGLGHFRDDIGFLESAIHYLKNAPS